MIKIEVKAAECIVKSGTSARTGKPYSIKEQEAYAHLLDRNGKPRPYPILVKISLGDDQLPYAIGNYVLGAESLYVNKFDQLEISPVLVAAGPIAQAKAA